MDTNLFSSDQNFLMKAGNLLLIHKMNFKLNCKHWYSQSLSVRGQTQSVHSSWGRVKGRPKGPSDNNGLQENNENNWNNENNGNKSMFVSPCWFFSSLFVFPFIMSQFIFCFLICFIWFCFYCHNKHSTRKNKLIKSDQLINFSTGV